MRYIRLTAVLLLAACGDGGTTPTSPPTPPTPPAPVATSITLSATSLSLASLGATSQLSATVKDQNGTSIPHPRRQRRRPYVDSVHFESVRLRS